MPLPQAVRDLMRGPLLNDSHLPLILRVLMCDLRPRFLPKGRVGRFTLAISRNGRVLLASPLPLSAWTGQVARLRVQTWHKSILPGDPPQAHGVLLCLHLVESERISAEYECRLAAVSVDAADLELDVGGRMVLTLRRVELQE